MARSSAEQPEKIGKIIRRKDSIKEEDTKEEEEVGGEGAEAEEVGTTTSTPTAVE